MNFKRQLRIINQIITEYDDGSIIQSMRNFVETLKGVNSNSGDENEEAIKQSLRVLFSDIDNSFLNIIPEQNLSFLHTIDNRGLIGSALKRTVMDIISDNSYTKAQGVQYFSNLLSDMTDLGEKLKSIKQSLSNINVEPDEISPDRAVINACFVPSEVGMVPFTNNVNELVKLFKHINSFTGDKPFKIEISASDAKDSYIGFDVDINTAIFFSSAYLGVLEVYSYISIFDNQINSLKILTSSSDVMKALEEEKKKKLHERLNGLAENMANNYFSEKTEKLFEHIHSVIFVLINKIEDGFNFDIEISLQKEKATKEEHETLKTNLFQINKILAHKNSKIKELLA